MAAQHRYYHPFSAPPTLERQKIQTNSWIGSTKEMFMKPWRLRSQRKEKRRGHRQEPLQPVTNSLTNFVDSSPFERQDFPNFSRLSPVGGRPQSKGRESNPDDFVDSAIGNDDVEVKIPESLHSSRPPLSNIFPMFDSLKTSTVTSINSTGNRRHSTPATPTSPKTTNISPAGSDRRISVSSADECRKGRRERRASVTRDIPLLPKRGQDPFQPMPQSHTQEPLPISPYSEFTGPPQNANAAAMVIDYSNPRQISLNYEHTHRPPVSPGGLPNSFSYPPAWAQPPHLQLQLLAEELEEDREGDGEEEGVKKVEELLVHVDKGDQSKIKQSGDRGMGKLKALRDIMSSKHKDEPAEVPGSHDHHDQVKMAATTTQDEDEIKGFDNFFMY